MRNVYWCKCAGGRNFGDALGPALVESFTGAPVKTTPIENADLVVVGSILEHLPERWGGTVAGIGAARASTRRDLSGAQVLALRGPRTRERVKISGPEPVLADPGLLASYLGRPVLSVDYETAALAHYADKTFKPPAGSLVVDITAPLSHVVEQVSRCSRVYTSSLHGLILADALGLPRMWAKYPKVQGGGFKFHDYAESLGMEAKPGEWQTAPADLVEEKKQQLAEVMSCL